MGGVRGMGSLASVLQMLCNQAPGCRGACFWGWQVCTRVHFVDCIGMFQAPGATDEEFTSKCVFANALPGLSVPLAGTEGWKFHVRGSPEGSGEPWPMKTFPAALRKRTRLVLD